MNKVYKIVWNESLGTWCAISEVSKTRGKRSSVKTTVAGALLAVSALTMSSMAGAIVVGFSNNVTDLQNNNVLGNNNTLPNTQNTTVLGNKNTATQSNTLVLGNNVTSNQANSVVLGNESTDRVATTVNQVAINGEDYTVAGAGSAANGVVSVGKVGGERQIINVAAGEISASSTDAVNGSQLYATHKAIADSQTHYFSVNDGGTQGNNYNNDGATGKNALAVGVGAKAVGENDIAIGSGAQAMGGRAVVIGLNAGSGNISDGDANVLIGLNAGTNNDGRWNTSVGSNSGDNTKGQRNTALGDYAGRDVTGNGNIGLGASAGVKVTGETNLAAGASAGGNVEGSHNTALGRTSGVDVIGNSNTATGLDSGSMVRGSSNSAYGQMSGRSVTGDRNVAIGVSSGSNISGNYNAALAYGAGNNGVGNLNTALGFTAGSEVNGDSNSAVGDSAGQRVIGNQNTAQGRVAGQDIFGHQNTAVGAGAGSSVGTKTNDSNYNSALGINAGRNVQGNSNLALGDTAGNNVTGSRNVALGRAAGQGLNNVDDATSLGSGAKAAVSNSVALGANSEAIRDVNSEVAYVPRGTTIVAANAAGGEVSVGTVGKERRITNVAAASQDTDAVNLSQLKAAQAAASTHYFSVNDGGTQGNNYNNDGATGKNALAVGVGAKAVGENAIAIGNVTSDAANSIAIGNNNSLSNSASSSTAIGHNNNVTGNEAIALGANNTVKDFSGVAVGSYNNAEGYRSIAVGAENKTKGQWSSAFGVWNIAEGERATVLGANNTIQGTRALGMGVANEISSASEYSSAVGAFNKITDSTKSLTAGFRNTVTGGDKNSVLGNENTLNNAKNTTVLGNKNTVAQDNTQVLGNNVTTTQANSVVLGNASTDRAASVVDKVTINGDDYAFAGVGSTANGVVSVGKVGGERQIINVAAGEISASSTDAINGSQLYATNQAIEKLYAGAGDTTHYVSINDGGTQGGNYNNDGAIGKNAVAVGVGASATGDGATALGLNSSAKSKDAVALGTDTHAELEGSVALGKGSVANTAAGIAGFDPLTGFGSSNTGSTWRSSAAAFSVGDVSRGITRQITGVAAGTADTDAVNVAQLKAAISKANEAKGSTETVSAGKNTEVTKTTKADGSTDYQVATKDDVSFDSVTVGNIKADSQNNTISGLADGKVSADSDQAINGSQLHDTAESVANALGGNAKVNPDGTIKTSNIGNTGKDNVHDAIASIHGQVAGAKTSVSAGKNTVVNSSTNADGSNNYQVALAEDIQLNSVTANQVTAKQVTANKVNVGKVTIDGTTNKVSGLANGEITSTSTDAINGSQLHQTNSSVAQHLGGGSTLNKDGSIGAPTYNVAGGTFHNVGDALGAIDTRVSNLEQAFYDTNKNMDDLRNDTYAGIAGAMAVGNLPQPTEAGMSMVSAGVSGYRGETAVAIGVSAITDSNKIVWKMGASADSRSNIGGAVSMGYQWK